MWAAKLRKHPKLEVQMTKSVVTVFVGLLLVASSPAFARQSSAPAQSGVVYGTWKAPYELPAGFGPNDVPFAPF